VKTKYIFVSGGVISGIGKGVTAASIGFLLKSAGYKVSPIKFEGYLNIDAGTINPIEHGDVFVCDDGTEADMDIGTYEKFLDQNMSKDNFVTMGQIYKTIIDRERRFEYHGEDVEAIHICDEIISRIKKLANKDQSDIVIIELGGTAGEYWNVFFYEASRILSVKNQGDVIHLHVSYVPTPKHLGEPKTKPTQLSVRTLNSMGIQPDFIITRSEKYIDQRRRDRFALYCNMNGEDIISNPDLKTVYEVPIILEKQALTQKILNKLGLNVRKPQLEPLENLVNNIKSEKKPINIAIVGKYFGTGDYQLRDSYAALFDAIDHACWQLGYGPKTYWIDAEQVETKGRSMIGKPDGIIVPIGWGERGAEGMIGAASYARKNNIPYLGLCYGMQLAVVAFARDILGWKDANTTENNPKTNSPVIHFVPGQEKKVKKRAYGGTMRLGAWNAKIKKNTLAFSIYKKEIVSERHRHRWEFNDRYLKDFEKNSLIISARSTVENLCEIIELPKSQHPFYFATQSHPEYKSRPLNPHPVFLSFIAAGGRFHEEKLHLG
jgi:CTP synthase